MLLRTLVLSTCAMVAARSAAQSVAPDVTTVGVPGAVPRTADTASAATPTTVISVPFELIDHRIVFQAEMNGDRGNFILDTGGGESLVFLNPLHQQSVASPEVTVRLGAATLKFNVSAMPFGVLSGSKEWGKATDSTFERPMQGVFGDVFMEPFETVFDFVRHRLVFIPLDQTGHRLASVPTYTAAYAVPLKLGDDQHWQTQVQIGDVLIPGEFDTGSFPNTMVDGVFQKVRSHLTLAGTDSIKGAGRYTHVTVDQLTLGGHAFTKQGFDIMPCGGPDCQILIGNVFFEQQGAVGFNFRTGQFIVYRQP